MPDTPLDDHTTAGLLWIANKLDARWHNHLMNEPTREAIALSAAHAIRNTHPDHAIDELENELLRKLPYATGESVTRHEYATYLREQTRK